MKNQVFPLPYAMFAEYGHEERTYRAIIASGCSQLPDRPGTGHSFNSNFAMEIRAPHRKHQSGMG